MSYSIAQLNQMNPDEFVSALGSIFEETPSIAQQVWQYRPFLTVEHLHQCMVAQVQSASSEEQLALIRAHPDLGSRTQMAPASVKEQSGAGLNQLTPDEYEQFQSLNQAYKETFGFPFIIAVRQQTPTSILAAFDRRLQNSYAAELEQALTEIYQIAWFRLTDIVTS
jgi:2-oxo-4-hydroxy-4-carboxy-5-ureidoimidazoline decarboxylase